jgi:hypothetical protein
VFRQFIGMLPFQTEERWRARDTNAFVSGAIMGSTRFGARILTFADATEFGGARGIIKTLSGRNVAGNISILVFGVGRSDGTSATDIDFLDFNGDGYPDVVGAGSVQATLPNGALEGRRIGVGVFPKVRQSENVSNNRNLGATTSALRSTAQNFGLNIFPEMGPFNIGIGISSSDGTSRAEWDLLDINGDGLPDFVQPSGGGLNVRLNLGYRFGAPEDWGGSGTLRFERSEASGTDGSAGFNLPAYSFGGGLASTRNRAGTESDLMDVNGDGLVDLVFKALSDDIASPGTAIQVRFNTGAGFLPPQAYTGALPRPIQSRLTWWTSPIIPPSPALKTSPPPASRSSSAATGASSRASRRPASRRPRPSPTTPSATPRSTPTSATTARRTMLSPPSTTPQVIPPAKPPTSSASPTASG